MVPNNRIVGLTWLPGVKRLRTAELDLVKEMQIVYFWSHRTSSADCRSIATRCRLYTLFLAVGKIRTTTHVYNRPRPFFARVSTGRTQLASLLLVAGESRAASLLCYSVMIYDTAGYSCCGRGRNYSPSWGLTNFLVPLNARLEKHFNALSYSNLARCNPYVTQLYYVILMLALQGPWYTV